MLGASRTSLHALYNTILTSSFQLIPASAARPPSRQLVSLPYPQIILPTPLAPSLTPILKGEIAADRAQAIRNFLDLPSDPTHCNLYSDGSRTPDGVGAAAIDLHGNRELIQRVGEVWRHTAYEAELAAIRLALELASTLPDDVTKCTIHTDNQTAIRALTSPPRARPGQDLILDINLYAARLRHRRPSLAITLFWIPGHENILGNERADKRAKDATYPPPSPLPPSYFRSTVATHTSPSATRKRIKKELASLQLGEATAAERSNPGGCQGVRLKKEG